MLDILLLGKWTTPNPSFGKSTKDQELTWFFYSTYARVSNVEMLWKSVAFLHTLYISVSGMFLTKQRWKLYVIFGWWENLRTTYLILKGELFSKSLPLAYWGVNNNNWKLSEQGESFFRGCATDKFLIFGWMFTNPCIYKQQKLD